MNADSGIRWVWSVVLGATLLLVVPFAGWVAAGRTPTVGEALKSLPLVAVASRVSESLTSEPVADPVAAAGEAQGVAGPATTESTKPDQPEAIAPTPAFTRELGAAGLDLSAGGDRILARAVGLGTPRQLLLSQMAADRFGIVHNPYFDPRRVAYSGRGENLIDLATGVYTNGQGVASDETLALLRARTGFDMEYARQFFVRTQSFERYIGVDVQGNPIYETYTPVAFLTPESFAIYVTSACANYLAMASSG